MPDERRKVVRIVVTRKIAFQGPAAWVRGTIARQIEGTVQVDDSRFIVAESSTTEEVAPVPNLVADKTLKQHRDSFRDRTMRKRDQHVQPK